MYKPRVDGSVRIREPRLSWRRRVYLDAVPRYAIKITQEHLRTSVATWCQRMTCVRVTFRRFRHCREHHDSRQMWRKGWCCRWVSNLRPLPYQGSALPLSYGSVPVRRSSRRERKAIYEAPKAGKVGESSLVDLPRFAVRPSPSAGLAPACEDGGWGLSPVAVFRCSRSLRAVRIPLIGQADSVVPRSRN